MFDIPILFLTFNRMNTAKKVFSQIKKQKPQFLYLASDGARDSKPNEKEQVEEIRSFLLSEIDWPCQVKTLFRDKNLGCGKAVSSAISWFFENEKMGIVLEDDCLPDDSFFSYCKEMLMEHENNDKIMHISGYNPLYNTQNGYDESYFYAKIHYCWGWASWQRAWKKYNFEITKNDIKKFCSSKDFKTIFEHASERFYWKNIFLRMANKEINTWDYQWVFAILKNKGICATPHKNLVTNIGFNEGGTHTMSATDLQINQKTYRIDKIIHNYKFSYDKDLCDKISSNVLYLPMDNCLCFHGKRLFNDAKYNLKKVIKKNLHK